MDAYTMLTLALALCALACIGAVWQNARLVRLLTWVPAPPPRYQMVHRVPVHLRDRLMERASEHGYQVARLGEGKRFASFAMMWGG